MRILDQARLGFREGKSDKVYEVDLVEVATDQYVVNFRFGRRGSALRDGTKTPVPVSLDKARALFSALVNEKTQGGYQALSADDETPLRSARSASDDAARKARTDEELLAALGRGHRSAIPLHLVVRKVGERGLQEAEPRLLELLASGSSQSAVKPEVFEHMVLSALARCGSARAIPQLEAVVERRNVPRHLRDVARLALTMIGGPGEQLKTRADVPRALQPVTGTELAAQIRAAEQLLTTSPAQGHAAIFGLYLGVPAVSNEEAPEALRWARRLVLSIARTVALRGQEFGLVRSLNWAAEIRRDAELFALLSRRFELDRDAKTTTLSYFRRRSARTLRRLGSIGSADYVKMASELLLLYRETDAEPVRSSDFGTWDAFARYHALNFVLYGSSPRYARAGHRRATWRFQAGHAPGQPPPARREESYPGLWDRAPEALWRLGVSDAATVVIHFATRALRGQSAYLASVDDVTVASALARAQRAMQLLAFEVARLRPPNLVLARGALAAKIDQADSWVLGWVERAPSLLRTEPELLAILITARSPRVREATAALTRGMVIDAGVTRALVSHSIAQLMQLGEEPEASERAASAAGFLLERASEALEGLSDAVLFDLLAHALPGVAELGAELVLRRARKGALADGLLDALLSSMHARVRSLGARILADTPPALMKDEPGLLVHFALSDNAELRQGTRALLAEVARLYPAVGLDMASRLLDALLAAQPTGVPAHVVSLLRHELSSSLPKRDVTRVFALLGALSPHAREAGGLLVALLGPDDLELDAIVRLASHEILLVRQGAWALAQAAKDRFGVTPLALARLCDARWPDSREFAFRLVKSFAPIVLVPDAVIAICDSIEPAVQRFGQTLLLQYWRDEHAARYLLRLSEHPSVNIQLLVSSLLERHARGNLELLEQLLPCFLTVLSQVNRGGVAKQRILTFLRREAVASVEAAVLLSPLLERQSLTRAVSHKAPLIATLVDLHERYPEVAVPISTPAVPVQSRSGRGV
jgi:hypothetical protein